MGQASVTRGEPVKVRITAKKRGLLPAAGICVTLRWQAPGEKEMAIRKWLRGIRCGLEEEVSLELPAPHCGCARLVAAKAGLCDYLGIFSLPVRVSGEKECCIMPKMEHIPEKKIDLSSLQALLWDGERDGDMFLRDFQPGDSIHRIYWKLSSKPGELQVRDHEQSGFLRVFLNYSAGFRGQADAWDRFLDKACSFLYFLLEEIQTAGTALDIVWRQGTELRGYEIHGAEAVRTWVYTVLMREDAGRLLVEEDFPFLKGGCHLEEDCRLYFGDYCVYE